MLVNPVSVPVSSSTSSAGALTSVASATSLTSILAANSSRKGATVYNSSTARLYLALGTTVSSASFTALLESGGYYEVPFDYTGAISGLWAAANGNALVTELT
jgi:hypothetical protein